MKIKFDANQEYQLDSIEAVTDLFKGQSRVSANIKLDFSNYGSVLAAVINRIDLGEEELIENLRNVQKRNGIRPDEGLECITETIDMADGKTGCRFPNFSVEMETGTGKTYVYLRTILELNRRYGMRKFVIVVPSVAIREGVLKTLRITGDHFKSLYQNPIYDYYVYDSANLTQVRQFALSDAIEIMVMTIQSFNKAANVIRQSTDRLQGETPIHLVQASRPILILDEPQNMESEASVRALTLLNPLFALRYSATHRNPYNVVYRLTPAEAYRQGLVKKIVVASVAQSDDLNRPFIRLDEIKTQKRTITAKLTVHKLMRNGTVKEGKVTVKPGDNLYEKTNRKDYLDYVIDEINPGRGFVQFANTLKLEIGEEIGTDKEDIFKAQIQHTIKEHLERQEELRPFGIKILTLFFIDRVANYVGDNDQRGLIRTIFDEGFNSIKESFLNWKDFAPDQVQAAYFAQKKRKSGEVEYLDSKSGETADDAAAYDLIMKKKETLLSFPGPEDDEETRRDKQIAFIFSHSALREGWDNPNIFQICTLNQTASIVKKRQEVGRGVRLAVNQKGDRIMDDQVNILTVVANESYKNYIETYQDEIAFEYRAEIEARYGKPIGDLNDDDRRKIEAEYGEGILPPPPRQAGQKKARLRKARMLSNDFKNIWDRIKHKTRYAVQINTEKLLNDVVTDLDRAPIEKPRVSITRASVEISDDGIFEALQMSAAKTAIDLSGRYPLPNLVEVMENLLEHTSPPVRLTRNTLLEVFKRAKNKSSATDNPQAWASIAVKVLKEKLADHIVDGIQYEKINAHYEMSQFEGFDDQDGWEIFSKYIYEPDESRNRTLYDLIPCDSEVERQFVRDLEARQDVMLYFKLPGWFKVPTPVGDYNPDWAIVMNDIEAEGKPVLYLVSETKGSTNLDDLRPDEKRKIKCGAAHFGSKQFSKKGALDGVDYKLVNRASELP